MIPIIKNLSKKVIQVLINKILLKKNNVFIINSIYENSPSWLINYIWGHAKQPTFNFHWKINCKGKLFLRSKIK